METTDQESLRQWQTQQHLDDEQDPPIEPPLHPLDPETVTALLMLICVPDPTGTILWKCALKRLAVLCHLIMPDVGAKSLDRIAKELTRAGVTTSRAALSVINVALFDAAGLRRTEKGESARESYRQRACRVWQKKIEGRGKKSAPNQ